MGFGDGTTSNAPSVSKTYDTAGVFRVRFRVFHPCGGFDDFIDSITVLAAPKTNGLTYDKPDPCRENQIRIKPNILLGTLGRVWVDSLNLSDSTRNPILFFPKAGIYWVKYAVIHPQTGCERIDSGQVPSPRESPAGAPPACPSAWCSRWHCSGGRCCNGPRSLRPDAVHRPVTAVFPAECTRLLAICATVRFFRSIGGREKF